MLGGYQADIDLSKKHLGILYEEKMRGIIGPRGQQVMLVPKTAANQGANKKNRRPKSDIRVMGPIDGVEEAMAWRSRPLLPTPQDPGAFEGTPALA